MFFDSNIVFKKIINKVSITSVQIGNRFPYNEIDGVFQFADLDAWTNGFWGGILWHAYEMSGDETFKSYAVAQEDALDELIEEYTRLHHDVGFMWLLTSGAQYKNTGNEKSRRRLLHMANILAGRFNIKGNYIRAWNSEDGNKRVAGMAIIDCMMNIPLLFWASNTIGDPRYAHIAKAHADTVLKYFIDDDGAVRHICYFDPDTGEFAEAMGGQGCSETSAWSRGAAWAIYGMALTYHYTKDERYLAASKKVCTFFINNLEDDYVSGWDFRAPNKKEVRDTSASAIAASGMLELVKYVKDKDFYLENAQKILQSLYENYSNLDNSKQAILEGATAFYGGNENIMVGLIYGDYYFVEAVRKLCDNSFVLPWEK